MKTLKSLLLVLGLSPMLVWAAGSMEGHASPASASKSAAGQPGKATDQDKAELLS